MWELDYKESWVLKNWCFWTEVLEKTLESPLDCKEIQSVHPKGDQSWVFIGRTDVDTWCEELIWKDPDAGKDWGQEEKRMTEDELVGWHHWLNGRGFGWTLGVVMDKEAGCTEVHGVAKSQTGWSDWTELLVISGLSWWSLPLSENLLFPNYSTFSLSLLSQLHLFPLFTILCVFVSETSSS